MKPDFFIVGAPKCGTTSMADWLRANPRIFLPEEKEPCFFSPDIMPSHYATLRKYEKLFRPVTEQYETVGEASTTYLESAVAVPRILEYQPEARFIVMVRSPLEMAPSLHAEELFRLNEDIESFEDAWNAQPERAAGRRIPTYCRSPRVLAYGSRCSLGEQLDRLYSRVVRERVHVVFLDDVKADPASAYRGVVEFLGVDAEPLPDFTPANQRHTHRWRGLMWLVRAFGAFTEAIGFHYQFGLLEHVRRWNRKYIDKSALSEDLRRRLSEYFRPDIRLLAELTGRNLDHWLV